MTLAELIGRYRLSANDRVEPYFVSDADVIRLLSEAQDQACVRGRLLQETDDPDICQVPIEAGVAIYNIHPSLFEIEYLAATIPDDPYRQPVLYIKSTEWLNEHLPNWRTLEGSPEFAILNETSVRLVPRPNLPGVLRMEGYRTAKVPMVNPDDEPEIHPLQHPHLVDFVEHKAFSIPDTEFFDPQRAAAALEHFTDYFGELPDSDMRRITREDLDHAVRGFMS